MNRLRDPRPLGPPTPRLCGRCRLTFAGDVTLATDLDTGWWACPPCRELLLGTGALAKPSWSAKARR
jgi:hypothetical protein